MAPTLSLPLLEVGFGADLALFTTLARTLPRVRRSRPSGAR